jgi:hypothetical protein
MTQLGPTSPLCISGSANFFCCLQPPPAHIARKVWESEILVQHLLGNCPDVFEQLRKPDGFAIFEKNYVNSTLEGLTRLAKVMRTLYLGPLSLSSGVNVSEVKFENIEENASILSAQKKMSAATPETNTHLDQGNICIFDKAIIAVKGTKP